MILALLGVALAAGPEVEVGGNAKSFLVVGWPYDSVFLPPDPFAQPTVAARLQGQLRWGPVTVQAHPVLVVTAGTGVGIGTGVGRSAPEAVPMTVTDTSGDVTTTFRMDWASVRLKTGKVETTVLRQPVSFGAGKLFTPLDLVAPFTPATLDTEHKPGIDAVRVDAYAGMATQVTVLAAYLGDWTVDGTGYAGHVRTTVGTTDLAAFGGVLYGEGVFGASVVAPVGPIGLYGDAALTLTSDGPRVRGVVGADWRPTTTTTITGEVYGQTFGTDDPAEYLAQYAEERFVRGDLWLAGKLYAGVAVSQEVTPLVYASGFVLGNLLDPSALVSGSVAWSAAENADLAAGVYVGVGARPEGVVVRSELGMVPVAAFLSMKFYF